MKVIALSLALTIVTAFSQARDPKYDQHSTMRDVKAVKAEIAALKLFDPTPTVTLTSKKGTAGKFRIFKITDTQAELLSMKYERRMNVSLDSFDSASRAKLSKHVDLINEVPRVLIALNKDLEQLLATHEGVRRSRVDMNRAFYFHKYTTRGQFKVIGRNEYPLGRAPSAFDDAPSAIRRL